jgi:hypothetical protein
LTEKQLGQEVRAFLSGFLGSPTSDVNSDTASDVPSGWAAKSSDRSTGYGERNMLPNGLYLLSNQAARLRESYLLVVALNRCYQVNPSSGEITFCFELQRNPRTYWWHAVPSQRGTVYCSLSGITVSDDPTQPARFGSDFGVVVEVDPASGSLRSVVDEATLVDPFGLQLVTDHLLLICDFEGWGGQNGNVRIADVRTGGFEVLAEGQHFIDPHAAVLDDEGVVWLANAMHPQYDGMVLRIDPGNVQNIVVPRHGPGSGILPGIFPSNDPGKVIFVRIDWPFMTKSGVWLLDKATQKVEALLEASSTDPKVYSMQGCVVEDVLWIAESYNNELIGFDMKSRSIAHKIDISAILTPAKGFGVKGIYDSFTFVECVNVVPPQLLR